MVIEVRGAAEDDESLAPSHKRVHSTVRDSDKEDEVELEHVIDQLFTKTFHPKLTL